MKKFIESTTGEFLAGALGGFLVVGILLILIFRFNLFNYEIKIIGGSNVDSVYHYIEKSELLKELMDEGVVVTPQVYTNNIVNYYNTALTILIAMLIIFSIVSYFQLRFISRKQIGDEFKESIRDSKEFDEFVSQAIFGKAEEKFVKIEDLDYVINKIENIDAMLNSIEQLESDLEKLKNKDDQLFKED